MTCTTCIRKWVGLPDDRCPKCNRVMLETNYSNHLEGKLTECWTVKDGRIYKLDEQGNIIEDKKNKPLTKKPGLAERDKQRETSEDKAIGYYLEQFERDAEKARQDYFNTFK